MLFTYLMIGIAFAIPELVLVHNWPWLGRLVNRNPIMEIVFSLALGFFMAKCMGIPAGVTIAIGNVFSTIITKVWYSLDVFDKIEDVRTWWNENRASIIQTAKDLVTVAKTIIRIITAPVRFCRAAKNKASATKNSIINVKGKVTRHAHHAHRIP